MRKTILLTIALASLIALSGCLKNTASTEESMEEPQSKIVKEMPKETVAKAPADMMKADTGMFEEYSEAKFAELKGSQPVALFFHANWCSTCKGIEKDLNANLNSIPKEATILQVNYDTETALKKEYGITMQSIIVFLNANGTEVKRLQGESTFPQIKEALMASL